MTLVSINTEIVQEDKLLTTQEVMKILRITQTNTMYKLITNGKLKASRLNRNYRIKQSDLDNFINKPSTEVSTLRHNKKKNKRCAK